MRIFGLIGKPLTHSFSPTFFQEKFNRENITNSDYRLFPLENLTELSTLICKNPQIEGLNVTIPFKREVIALLNELDETARQISAVNTIKISRQNKSLFLKGYNTDAFGFQHACDGLHNNNKALVLGTGGSAQAVKFVLASLHIQYLLVSRNPTGVNEIGYESLSQRTLDDFRLIINTTPLGMFPNIDEAPPIPYHLLSKNHFLFDLIYNPAETLFMKKGKEAGATVQNGELMLELQAERSWEIWND